jgi:hypothetical protein
MCAALLLACGDAGGGRDTQVTAGPITAPTGIVTSPGSAADPSGDETSAGTGDTGSGEVELRPGAAGSGGPDPDPETGEPAGGCQKIDFLFVVDNSGSMADEQTALANSFDGFITSIQSTVMAEDYHIMVIDTDAGSSFLQECLVLCQVFPTCEGYPCDMLPVPEGCDASLGAGLIANPKGDDCGVAGGKRYMVDGQPNLSQTFECVAKVGTNGDGSERPMEAMSTSISVLNGVGACNEGFLRKDALLVVTFITDEEDDEESNGNPIGWNAALVAAKYGKQTSIVVLGLVGDTGQPNAVCGEGEAEDSPRLREFAESFTYGSWASICSLDYAPFFDAAVSVIDTACEAFEPPA